MSRQLAKLAEKATKYVGRPVTVRKCMNLVEFEITHTYTTHSDQGDKCQRCDQSVRTEAQVVKKVSAVLFDLELGTEVYGWLAKVGIFRNDLYSALEDSLLT